MFETPAQYHAFLKKWSKGKPIIKQGESNYHAAGKWCTRIDPAQIKSLVDANLAVYKGGQLKLL